MPIIVVIQEIIDVHFVILTTLPIVINNNGLVLIILNIGTS